MHTLEDLQHFVDTRANQIILTQPRPMTLHQPPQAELVRLFRDLVDDRPEAMPVVEPSAPSATRTGAVPAPESPAAIVRANP